MSTSLSAFMAQNVQKREVEKVLVSKRFKDADENIMKWEIQAITSGEDEELRKQCTKKVQIPGKLDRYRMELDSDKYIGLLAAKCTLFPDLWDAQLQDSYGVMGADVLLKAMLFPGEYAEYLQKVQAVNGFNITMNELVDEAKN